MKAQIKEIWEEIKRLESGKPKTQMDKLMNDYIIKWLKEEIKRIVHIIEWQNILESIK